MATAPPTKKKKKGPWYKDPTTLGVIAVGGIAGAYVVLRRRNAGGKGLTSDVSGTGDGSQTGGIPGAPYSSAGVDLYNAVQDSTASLRERLEQLSMDVQNVNLRLQRGTPSSAQPAVPPRSRFGIHRIGRVGRRYTISSQAQQYNTTVARLRALNPSLRGNYIPGGFPLRTPL